MMTLRRCYLLLCVLGAILPLAQFVPWLMAHGLDPALFLRDLFANRVSGFFGMDVILSAMTLLLFIGLDAAPVPRPARVAAGIATLLVGVSLGLPLYLLLRHDGAARMG
jgi:Terpene cyclase DEP1